MSEQQPAPRTQQHCTVPLSDRSRTATGTAQWLLSDKRDQEISPIRSHNTLQTYICGEEAFKAIAQDIRSAEQSIDIVCWGFDPAMELERQARQWPRGDTWGDLLRLATEGKLDARTKVQVRVLAWYDELVDTITDDNLPGYSTVFGWRGQLKRHSFNDWAGDHKYARPSRAEQNDASRLGAQFMQGAQLTPEDYQRLLTQNTRALSAREVQQRRQNYNLRWYSDVSNGRVQGLSLRLRRGLVTDALDALARERKSGQLSGIELLGLEFAATHHQKSIVIDYHGKRPRAYVLGLNSVTDYWDTQEHRFNDPRRGALFEGGAADHSAGQGWDDPTSDKHVLKPYQDYACRIEGEAVACVYRNFVQGWNGAAPSGPGGGTSIPDKVDPHQLPKNLTASIKAPFVRLQVLRTLPEAGERQIERLYYQNIRWPRHYLYIENQYFQHTAWAAELKAQRQTHVNACKAGGLYLAQVPTLHVIVVTPTAERSQMVPRTHDTVAELGQADSMPRQDAMIKAELKRRADYETRLEEYRKLRAPYDAKNMPFPYLPPPAPERPAGDLEAIIKAYEQAGGTRDSQAVRKTLAEGLRMRTLVASLWSYDEEWSLAGTPIGRQVEAEQAQYQRRLKDWQRSGGGDARSAPIQPPPDRSKALKEAAALRYREVYIHSKLMIVDDSMLTLGSANLNLRSFASDSEINIATDDAQQARSLRQRVWHQHTKGQFDGGGDATDPTQMSKTFDAWERRAEDNLNSKPRGAALTNFLVKFHDDRTSTMRLA